MSIETMTKLATTTLSSNTATVTFSNIPQSYTDLVVRISVRTNGATTPYLYARFNGSSTGYSNRRIVSDGNVVSSSAPSDAYIICGFSNTTDQTANTFSSVDLYIPNYSGNNFKSVSSEAAAENNATSVRQTLFASLWSNSSAINSISFTDDGSNSFITHSTFTLYGVKAMRTAVGNGGAAYGGARTFDGTYFYHTFTSSGTLVVNNPLLVDYLVVAGGGGGGGFGAGGAGGMRCTVTASGGSPGTVESALSLTTGTSYTVTVGAGGAGTTDGAFNAGTNGSNSVFSTITSIGGGAGNQGNGNNGGSGGGGLSPGIGGTGTTNQGFGGGTGYNSGAGAISGGGGGGAGAIGQTVTSGNGGNGGAGVATSISGSSVTYAGGGGGGGDSRSPGTSGGTGGSGGGGNGSGVNTTTIGAGAANTGGGGGGSGYASSGSVFHTPSKAGGSGIVIIRYKG